MQQMGVPHVFLDIRVGREHLKHLMDLNIDTVPVLFKETLNKSCSSGDEV